MSKPLLVIGNKNLSSWSLRPWLALKVAGVAFDEKLLLMDTPGFKDEVQGFSPTCKVPVLLHDGCTIWESLAICEYAAETWAPSLWPAGAKARAVARSVSHEMHAGFLALRRSCPMNLKGDFEDRTLAGDAGADVHRILQLWHDCRARFAEGGPFLFGAFSIADAMFAPITTRFTTYGIPADEGGQRYIATIQSLPAFIEWKSAALLE